MYQTQVGGKVVCISAAILSASAFLASAQTPQRTLLLAQVPAVVSSLKPLGRLDGSTRLNLSINLPLHNREPLANLIERLYEPAEP
jgi:hypothetical protein